MQWRRARTPGTVLNTCALPWYMCFAMGAIRWDMLKVPLQVSPATAPSAVGFAFIRNLAFITNGVTDTRKQRLLCAKTARNIAIHRGQAHEQRVCFRPEVRNSGCCIRSRESPRCSLVSIFPFYCCGSLLILRKTHTSVRLPSLSYRCCLLRIRT